MRSPSRAESRRGDWTGMGCILPPGEAYSTGTASALCHPVGPHALHNTKWHPHLLRLCDASERPDDNAPVLLGELRSHQHALHTSLKTSVGLRAAIRQQSGGLLGPTPLHPTCAAKASSQSMRVHRPTPSAPHLCGEGIQPIHVRRVPHLGKGPRAGGKLTRLQGRHAAEERPLHL